MDNFWVTAQRPGKASKTLLVLFLSCQIPILVLGSSLHPNAHLDNREDSIFYVQ